MNQRLGADPYAAVLKQFNKRGIRYVVVGMAAINYYAKDPAGSFSTLDYDIFLEPTLRNLEQALLCLEKMGFALGTSAGGLKPLERLGTEEWRALVRHRRTLVATTPDGLMVELLLEVSGFSYSDLARDAATFTVNGVPVRVGRLTKLLRSKEVAGRPKDRQFLRRYRLLLEERDE